MELKGATLSDEVYNFASDIALAGITGYTSGYHKIVGCSNSGEICYSSGRAKSNVAIGGINGYIAHANGSYVYNCRNTAKITAAGSVPGSTYLCVGGIFGRTQQNIFDSCSNTAEGLISSTSISQRLFIGGIGGTTSSGDAVKITNCTNEAKISSTSATATSTYIGGILGCFWSNVTQDLIIDIEAVDDERIKSLVDMSFNATATQISWGLTPFKSIADAQAMDRQYDGSWGTDLVGYGRLAAVAKDGQG